MGSCRPISYIILIFLTLNKVYPFLHENSRLMPNDHANKNSPFSKKSLNYLLHEGNLDVSDDDDDGPLLEVNNNVKLALRQDLRPHLLREVVGKDEELKDMDLQEALIESRAATDYLKNTVINNNTIFCDGSPYCPPGEYELDKDDILCFKSHDSYGIDNYPGNYRVQWIISSSNTTGTNINISCPLLYTQFSKKKCYKDRLTIFYETFKVGRRFCGKFGRFDRSYPKPIKINFRTDGHVNRPGFACCAFVSGFPPPTTTTTSTTTTSTTTTFMPGCPVPPISVNPQIITSCDEVPFELFSGCSCQMCPDGSAFSIVNCTIETPCDMQIFADYTFSDFNLILQIDGFHSFDVTSFLFDNVATLGGLKLRVDGSGLPLNADGEDSGGCYSAVGIQWEAFSNLQALIIKDTRYEYPSCIDCDLCKMRNLTSGDTRSYESSRLKNAVNIFQEHSNNLRSIYGDNCDLSGLASPPLKALCIMNTWVNMSTVPVSSYLKYLFIYDTDSCCPLYTSQFPLKNYTGLDYLTLGVCENTIREDYIMVGAPDIKEIIIYSPRTRASNGIRGNFLNLPPEISYSTSVQVIVNGTISQYIQKRGFEYLLSQVTLKWSEGCGGVTSCNTCGNGWWWILSATELNAIDAQCIADDDDNQIYDIPDYVQNGFNECEDFF